ncbi:MAG: hypothetical protein ACREXT_06565, partial [Gammaproteobacteria bacterium]
MLINSRIDRIRADSCRAPIMAFDILADAVPRQLEVLSPRGVPRKFQNVLALMLDHPVQFGGQHHEPGARLLEIGDH